MTENKHIDDLIKFTSEKLEIVNKKLELSFKYLVLVFVLFLGYLLKKIDNSDSIPFLGIKIEIDILLNLLPVISLYLLSKMALTTMIFLELAEFFFSKIKEEHINIKKKIYRSLRPRGVFLSILLTKNDIENKKIKKNIYIFLSSAIYTLPGFNMAIILFSTYKYVPNPINYILIFFTVFVYGILWIEYFNGTYSKKYRHILYSTYISFVISCIILFYKFK